MAQPKKDRHIRIKMKYLRQIQFGSKTLEARANYSSLRKIRAGQNLIFYCNDVKVKTKVVAIRKYKDVVSMIDSEDLEILLPDHSRQEAISVYRAIYPDQKVKENNGMLVIEVKTI
ncbi:MAG: ASCH domain-containing protein [Patescibacteria group bacterium]|nr:ASCH domain-containing protein [Patescibacteria group bacterium]